MWVGKIRDKCIEPRKELITNKYWKVGGIYLERAMGSTWWEWFEGSRYFLWWYPKESWGDIRDGQKQWQVGPWPHFIHTQRLERDDNVAAKASGKLAKVRRRGYVRVGEIKILTCYLSVTKGEDISMV